MINGLKPYMGYSNMAGSAEGAILIFAHSIKEAKKIGWRGMPGDICDVFTDMRIEWLGESDHLFTQVPQWSKSKLEKSEAHVVDNPPCCKGCNLWGYELNEQGLCETCAEDEEGVTGIRDEKKRKADAELAALEVISAYQEAHVMAHMDQDAREQYAEGLLGEDEINDSIEDVIFQPLSGFAEYKKITTSDFDCLDYGDDVSYTTTAKADATPNEWKTLKSIRAIVQPLGGTAVLQSHRADCGHSDCEYIYRSSIKVTLPACPGLKFKRQYAV